MGALLHIGSLCCFQRPIRQRLTIPAEFPSCRKNCSRGFPDGGVLETERWDGLTATNKKTENIMKNLNKILTMVAFTATFSLAGVASAQNSIVTSPRGAELRNHVWMVKGATSAPVVAVGYLATGDDGITASPKYRQLLNEQYAQVDAQLNAPQVASTGSVGYRATGDDGITASPKYRQFLNEHPTQFQVAPLK